MTMENVIGQAHVKNKNDMRNLLRTLQNDLLRIRIDNSIKSIVSAVCFNQSYKCILLYRIHKSLNFKLLKMIMGGVTRIYQTHTSVFISPNADIGEGFSIGHCLSIMIASCKMGRNCTVMQQVTIGSSRGGNRPGNPIIGNNVYIACGAKIIGNVKIGNNVIIGANAVVTKDIPDNAIVGGVPAKILNFDGERQTRYWNQNLKDYIEFCSQL